MIYKILKTNENNTVDVELRFNEHDEYMVIASNIEIGNNQSDLDANILATAQTISEELTKNLATSLPYQPVLNEQVTVEL
jgi:hypothetical protein